MMAKQSMPHEPSYAKRIIIIIASALMALSLLVIGVTTWLSQDTSWIQELWSMSAKNTALIDQAQKHQGDKTASSQTPPFVNPPIPDNLKSQVLRRSALINVDPLVNVPTVPQPQYTDNRFVGMSRLIFIDQPANPIVSSSTRTITNPNDSSQTKQANTVSILGSPDIVIGTALVDNVITPLFDNAYDWMKQANQALICTISVDWHVPNETLQNSTVTPHDTNTSATSVYMKSVTVSLYSPGDDGASVNTVMSFKNF